MVGLTFSKGADRTQRARMNCSGFDWEAWAGQISEEDYQTAILKTQ